MANSLFWAPVCSFKFPNKPGIAIDNSVARKSIWVNEVFHKSRTAKIRSLEVKAADSNKSAKPNSIVCADCDGNGAKQCSQCKGTGVNSVDHFGGQFKAGGLCWLCRGKRDILCGNCNGAGFIGGFMSTIDE
ncbi:protein BUNDLE SHEATH DEFECTIVE 2, chloroplastic-like isoform X2 [Mangifera indica]|uniref:protein BUNDLE SHEATH DEFECTIVE 2, chloroplastic-like isoform X2 n=1 Tax=Mangifera indica TaxID=29780 RepID=UPI001CF93D27|nr:protein BUNDLE SHEATH DEFECTIVE 2, chloroplastic-like isoform X2 [Mangifera indica]